MQDYSYTYIKDNFLFAHNSTQKPFDINTHIHDGYEIFYHLSGDLTYYIEGQAYQVEPQDIIITNRRELHRIVFNSQKPYKRKFIQFKPEYVLSFLQSEVYNPFHYLERRKLGFYNKINSKEVKASGIPALLDKMEAAARRAQNDDHFLIKLLFMQMLIEINRIYSSDKNIITEPVTNYDKLTEILNYINTNLEKKLTLDLFENKFFVNKYYLCHVFKQNTGFTVNEYITYKRIMKAQELLNRSIPVLEAADESGFGDYSSFYRAFKKIVGSSPQKYSKSGADSIQT
jgi:YesN/AraC family two-component response regulator